MATALICDICGGKLQGKPGGVFECDSCGMEYSTEWARAKIQEIKGTVQVEGTVQVQGTVAIEGSTNKDALLKRGYLALEDGEWEDAANYFDQALNADAECAQAYLGKVCADFGASVVDELGDMEPDDYIDHPDYRKARRFADEALSAQLSEIERRSQTKLQVRLEREAVEKQCTAERLLPVIQRCKAASALISAGTGNGPAVALRPDGTVVAVGNNDHGQCDVSGWRDIVAVAAGNRHTVGLRADGTVVAVGNNDHGQCDVSGWRDIVAVAADAVHTVGLRSDGTVVAVGDNDDGRCDVSGWRDIVAVAAGYHHTVGLRFDGTVVAVGNNLFGICDVSDWRDIVAVAAGFSHTVGLRSDGTVVAIGAIDDVSDWRDIVAIAAGLVHTVGLRSDGTVVTTDDNDCGECDVSDWRNIVAISAGCGFTMGLTADGHVVLIKGGESNIEDIEAIAGIRLFQSIDTLEAERKEGFARQEAERREELARQEAKRREELARQAAIEEKRKAIAALRRERESLGLFSVKQKKEIDARIAAIEAEIQKL